MATTTAAPSIGRVRSAQIYTADQERAVRFWTETMGCELVRDSPMSPEPGGPRWIEVKPPNGDVVLVLYTPPGSEDLVGRFSSLIFHVDDIQATAAAMKERGVEFTAEPKLESWGQWWAQFKDPDGNEYGLGQD